MLPRPVFVPTIGWISVCPLQYGNIIRWYENWPVQSLERWAALFRTALPGCEDLTAEDVGRMPAGLPATLEYAITVASDLVDRDGPDEADDEDDEEDMGMFAPPEEAVEKAEEYKECDLYFALHQHNETYREFYQMLVPELDALLEGADRANDRNGSGDGETSSGTSGPVDGNRGGSHTSLWQ